MEDPVAVGLIQQARNDLGRLVGLIAREGRIWPLATQGHIADMVPNRILYDAQTTGGGSGSPVFDRNGALIAIHSATMTRFGAVSFGVPVERLRELLPTHRPVSSAPPPS
jgi:S1-C subfamily serine protease